MNNAYTIENYNELDSNSIPRAPFINKRLGELTEILEAISSLQRNDHYRKFKKLYLEPRLESLTKQMRFEADPVKLYRIQGRTIEASELYDLEKMRKGLENEYLTLKGQLKQ